VTGQGASEEDTTIPLYTIRYILADSMDLEIAEYEPDSPNIKAMIRERKVQAANDDEAKLKVWETLQEWNRKMNLSDPKFMKILDILDDRGRSLKHR
jgi:hypothetical protein